MESHHYFAASFQLDPVPAVQRNVPAGASQAFDLTLRLTAVVEEFDFNCIMKLYDSELNQLDIKSFDLLTGKAAVSVSTTCTMAGYWVVNPDLATLPDDLTRLDMVNYLGKRIGFTLD